METRTLWTGQSNQIEQDVQQTEAETQQLLDDLATEIVAAAPQQEAQVAGLVDLPPADDILPDMRVNNDTKTNPIILPINAKSAAKTQPSVFGVHDFQFPYLYRFPGQDKEEKILYVTREAKVMWQLRQIFLVTVGIITILILWWLGAWLDTTPIDSAIITVALWVLTATTALAMVGVWLWMKSTWEKTLGIITTYRLVKIVQVNPLSSVTQSLPLKEVVDTSSDSKGLLAAILKVSTFTARSSATSSGLATEDAGKGKARINRKYFYFENITNSADLEHYMNKLIHAMQTHTHEEMKSFRPFIPHLKAGAREDFMRQYPEYWS